MNTKRDVGMPQVVEHLPGKCEALIPTLRTAKEKE
jgi:hypothetical protein